MKKSIISALVVASALVGLTGCGSNKKPSSATPAPASTSVVASSTPAANVTKVGEISYTNTYGGHGTTYGMKVKVTFDASNKIVSVEREAHDYVECTSSWNLKNEDEENVPVAPLYEAKLADVLATYVGDTAQSVYDLARTGVTLQKGADGNTDFTYAPGFQEDKHIAALGNLVGTSGATQSASRLLIAVANACAELLEAEKLTVKDYVTPSEPGTGTTSGSVSAE